MGVCGSTPSEPVDAPPRNQTKQTSAQRQQQQQFQSQQQPQRTATKSGGQTAGGTTNTAATESARRRQRAAAAELRMNKQQNRGKSTTSGGTRFSNGTEDSLLYPNLNTESTNISTGSKRPKSQWEIENADGLGAAIMQTNEKA